MNNKFSFMYGNSITFFLLSISIFIDLSIVDIVNQFNLFSNIENMKLIFNIVMALSIIGICCLLFQTRSIVLNNKNILNNNVVNSGNLIILIEVLIIGLLIAIIFQTNYD